MSNIICKIQFGSHLYGTATDMSDNDFKGIFMPDKKDVLLGRIPRSINMSQLGKKQVGELDYEIYSLHHFFNLAAQGQTVAIDMLCAPNYMVTLYDGPLSHIWNIIIVNKHIFFSKNMRAFIGYARGQAAKYSLKGERLGKLQDFCCVLDTQQGVLKDCWSALPKDEERTNPQGVRELRIAGKWFGETTAIETVQSSISKQLAAYGTRTQAAYEAGGIDWKALSHAVRVTKEVIEIAQTGDIQFPLRDAKLILQIKQGELSLERVQDIIDYDLQHAEHVLENCNLPDKVNQETIDAFLLSLLFTFLST